VSPRRLWISGPVRSLEAYAEAARAAGWEPWIAPLIEIEPLPFEWPEPGPDWLCVASASALPSLIAALERDPARLVGLPFAAVGGRSFAELERRGARPLLGPSPDAQALLAAFEHQGWSAPGAPGASPRPGRRALVLHGDRSSRLAEELFARGFEVLPRLAYRNRELRPAPPTDTAWVLLASPSAVDALAALPAPPTGWLPIAIGTTTQQRILHLPLRTAAAPQTLADPTPRALSALLTRLPEPPAAP
jgi:uroporphyrinogen-III synthase